MKARAALLACCLVSCTSAAVPGAGDTIDQADRARELQLEVALTDAARAMSSHLAETGTYPANVQDLVTRHGYRPPEGVIVTIAGAGPQGYCIQATHPSVDTPFHITDADTTMSPGPC